MYLVEADAPLGLRESDRQPDTPAPLAGGRWQDFPYSRISHHDAPCCHIAREWVVAMDFAQLNGGNLASGPRWLRQKYKWGPTAWPAFWCQIVREKSIDCGAHAALAHEVFTARGQTSFPAQLVQQYSADATSQWRGKWSDQDVSCHWIDEDVIYHEGTALLVGDEDVKLWDASAGAWINPRQAGGYGSLIAVRVFAEGQFGGGDGFRWGERRIKPNQWVGI
jgi:hypothetical protein